MMPIDNDLEALIEKAGRERVFAIVRKLGWSAGDEVPKYVWQEVALNAARDPYWEPGYAAGPLESIASSALNFLGL